MAGRPTQGLMAQGPLPAGMLRIRLGQQERYVWPVHLPGWLGLGWRVAGVESPGTKTPLAGPAAPESQTASARDRIADEQTLEPEVEDTKPSRSRRGRPRKEKTSAVADPVAAPQEQEPEPAAETAAAPGADDTSEPTADSDANPEVLLTDLPDDLFDDPLI